MKAAAEAIITAGMEHDVQQWIKDFQATAGSLDHFLLHFPQENAPVESIRGLSVADLPAPEKIAVRKLPSGLVLAADDPLIFDTGANIVFHASESPAASANACVLIGLVVEASAEEIPGI